MDPVLNQIVQWALILSWFFLVAAIVGHLRLVGVALHALSQAQRDVEETRRTAERLERLTTSFVAHDLNLSVVESQMRAKMAEMGRQAEELKRAQGDG